MPYLRGRTINSLYSSHLLLIRLLHLLLTATTSTCTTRDLLVFTTWSVATYCELGLWTWSVIKSVSIYRVEFEHLAPRYPCSCLDLSKKQPLESLQLHKGICNRISGNRGTQQEWIKGNILIYFWEQERTSKFFWGTREHVELSWVVW